MPLQYFIRCQPKRDGDVEESSEMRIVSTCLVTFETSDSIVNYCIVNKVTLLPSPASEFLMGQLSYISMFSKYADFTFPPFLENHLKSTAGIDAIWDEQR